MQAAELQTQNKKLRVRRTRQRRQVLESTGALHSNSSKSAAAAGLQPLNQSPAVGLSTKPDKRDRMSPTSAEKQDNLDRTMAGNHLILFLIRDDRILILFWS